MALSISNKITGKATSKDKIYGNPTSIYTS